MRSRVLAGGRRLGAVVAELSLKPYESSAQTALIASLVLGASVLLVVAVAARLLIRGALKPVAHMTAPAAAWTAMDIGRRFGLGPPRDELTQLAATLDSLLDRVATSLRHEQRFSAELSHELRTSLATVIAEAQLALRHPRSADEYRAGYERVLPARASSRARSTRSWRPRGSSSSIPTEPATPPPRPARRRAAARIQPLGAASSSRSRSRPLRSDAASTPTSPSACSRP